MLNADASVSWSSASAQLMSRLMLGAFRVVALLVSSGSGHTNAGCVVGLTVAPTHACRLSSALSEAAGARQIRTDLQIHRVATYFLLSKYEINVRSYTVVLIHLKQLRQP